MKTIVLIEDDEKIAALLTRHLEEHYTVKHFINPLRALENLPKLSDVGVVILDLTLPHMDGLEVCTKIREQSSVPIIISSARRDIDDKLFALENGADDYLPKPYDVRELLARVNLLSKRVVAEVVGTKKVIELDESGTDVYVRGEKIALTMSEYEILKLLYEHPNQTIPRMVIANTISKHRLESAVESINVLIARLRKKIEPDTAEPMFIETVRGVGYRFNDAFLNS